MTDADVNLFTTYGYWRLTANATPATCLRYPLPAGSYTLRLYFCNVNSGTSTVGSRVFDVVVQGATVLPSFDIIAAANGTQRAIAVDLPLVVADGWFNLGFVMRSGNPMLNGFAVFAQGAAPTTLSVPTLGRPAVMMALESSPAAASSPAARAPGEHPTAGWNWTRMSLLAAGLALGLSCGAVVVAAFALRDRLQRSRSAIKADGVGTLSASGHNSVANLF